MPVLIHGRAAHPRTLAAVLDGRPAKVWLSAARTAAERLAHQFVATAGRLSVLKCGTQGASLPAAVESVLEHSEHLIVVMAPCLPDPTFFPFAAELLDRWRDEPDVLAISGHRFSSGCAEPFSYHFVRHFPDLVWATWRRCSTRAVESCLAGSGNHLIAVPCSNLVAPVPGDNQTRREASLRLLPRARLLVFPLDHPSQTLVEEREQHLRAQAETRHGRTVSRLRNEVLGLGRRLRRLRRRLRRLAWLGRGVLPAGAGNRWIAAAVRDCTPRAVGKIGRTELDALHYYLKSSAEELTDDWGRCGQRMFTNAGVFPSTGAVLSHCCRELMKAVSGLDLIALWDNPGETRLVRVHAKKAAMTRLDGLSSFVHVDPWTHQLAGRRVLVVSPFAATIESQYERRDEVWARHPKVLPTFALETLATPFPAAIERPPDADWSSCLDRLRSELDDRRFDVALIGAGAWSLPLVLHCKRLGRIGIHLGGSLQLLFGIKGRRWDQDKLISEMLTPSWVRPSPGETPSAAGLVERGCYW